MLSIHAMFSERLVHPRPGSPRLRRMILPAFFLSLSLLSTGCPAAGTDANGRDGGGGGTDAAITDSGASSDSGVTDSGMKRPCTNLRADPATGVGVSAVCGFGGTEAYAITSLSGELIALPGLQRLALPFPMGAFGPDPQGIGCGPDGLVWITLSFGVDQVVGVDVSNPSAMAVVKTVPLAAGATPRGLSFGMGGAGESLVYIANAGNDTISVVDAGTETVSTSFPLTVPGAQDSATPLAVLTYGDRLLVANAALDASFVPGPGFVTVIERSTGTELNFIPATQPQPTFLALDPDGSSLLVVNGGIIDFFSGPMPIVDTAGGLDVMALSGLDTAAAPDANLALTMKAVASPTLGGLGAVAGLALGAPGGDVFAGNALTGDLFRFDTSTGLVTRDTDDPIVVFPGSGGYTGVHLVNGTLAVTDFGTDDVCFTDDPSTL